MKKFQRHALDILLGHGGILKPRVELGLISAFCFCEINIPIMVMHTQWKITWNHDAKTDIIINIFFPF